MLLSALLTSVGINLLLCILFFTLYSILRKQPENVTVYMPRLLAKNKLQRSSGFDLERLIPSPGWIKQAWQPSEDELLSLLGLDAVVFLRIFIFSVRVFAFAGIVGICILLPVNYFGSQLSEDSDLQNTSLDKFSISNVNDGSSRLWVHFSAVYIFTGFVCYLLYYEYNYISGEIINYFYARKPLPQQFTVLVRGIRVTSGSSTSEEVDNFFRECYPSTYLSHSVIHPTSAVQKLIADAEKINRKLLQLKSDANSPNRNKRDGLFGLIGRKVNIIEYNEKKLEDLEVRVKTLQLFLAGQDAAAAFVSFRTRLSAAIPSHIQQRINPTQWVTEPAPEPQDVHWPFFSSSFLWRWTCIVFAVTACVAITILFLIPVVIVQGLANLEQLETWFPSLTGILETTVVSEVITGYLPSLILQLFLSFIPPVMIILSSIQGYMSFSQIQKSACIKVLWFTLWNIYFANALSGSAFYRVSIFLEPRNIPQVLAEAVPGQASFFISYVVTSGWTTLASELFRLFPLIGNVIGRLFRKKDADEFKAPPIPYHSEIPKILFFGLLGITYFFLAPLILPFILVYYCMGYIVFRNQLLNVYILKYETDGKLWPVVHSTTIFSLILMQIIAIGIFGLKKLYLASILIIPLPVLTLLFHLYCHKRFLPIFRAIPAEMVLDNSFYFYPSSLNGMALFCALLIMQAMCFIRKDKEDQKDPAIHEFYDKLATAYEDPSLKPVHLSGETDSRTTPLLQTAEELS